MLVPELLADPAAFQSMWSTHLSLLREHEFDTLEARLTDMARSQASFPDGEPHLAAAMYALGEPSSRKQGGWLAQIKSVLTNRVDDDAWEFALEDINFWRDTKPSSLLATTALSRACVGYGYQLRGGDWAHTVPEKDWPTIMSRFRRGYDALRTVESRGAAFAPWGCAMLTAIKLNGLETGQWYAVFERMVAAHPKYWPLFTNGADFHMERWSGSDHDLVEYSMRAVELSNSHSGNAAAARIFAWILSTYVDTALDDARALPWDIVKSGFGHWYRQHPHPSVLSYGLLASRVVEDKISARNLLRLTAGAPHRPTWETYLAGTFGGFQGVVRWAQSA